MVSLVEGLKVHRDRLVSKVHKVQPVLLDLLVAVAFLV